MVIISAISMKPSMEGMTGRERRSEQQQRRQQTSDGCFCGMA